VEKLSVGGMEVGRRVGHVAWVTSTQGTGEEFAVGRVDSSQILAI
jgi:hypothetical protein